MNRAVGSSAPAGTSSNLVLAHDSTAILLQIVALQARVATRADAVAIRVGGTEEGSFQSIAVGEPEPLDELIARVCPVAEAPPPPEGHVLKLERMLVVSTSLDHLALGSLSLGLYRERDQLAEKDALWARLLTSRLAVALATAISLSRTGSDWLELVLNQYADGIALLDASGSVRFENLALRALIASQTEKEAALTNGALPRLAYRSGDPIPAAHSPIQAAWCEQLATVGLECLAPGSDGSPSPVLLSAAPLHLGGCPSGGIVIVQEAGAAEERACEHRVVVFGHDLRQPLNVITLAIGMAQRSGRETLSEPQRRALDRIAHAAARLDGMIDHLVHR